MTHSLIKTALGAMVLLSMMACTTNYYDEEKYNEYIKYNSPVDSVDQYHQWRLTEERSYKITANVNQDVEKVMLLTANPLSSTKAEVMNESVIAKGESKWMTVSVPMIQSTLYAALVDKDGIYYVKSFPVTQTEIDFSGGINTGTPVATLKPQTYTYLYEKDFPVGWRLRLQRSRIPYRCGTYNTQASGGSRNAVSCGLRRSACRIFQSDGLQFRRYR